jgi:DNA-binding MarR family transcriptional regulator
MADTLSLLSDLERGSARLAAAVDLRLRRETGLPLVFFEPMAVIAGHNPCRIYELATELGVSSGGASKLADRLEAHGHCRRLPNPRDRRSSVLTLTPAGGALLAAAEPIATAELTRQLGARLSASQITQLAGILRDLRYLSMLCGSDRSATTTPTRRN